MVKKISAVILALVLCLSVVVMPASAAGFAEDYTLPDGARIAFKVELDKEYYSAGDVATISVYAYADDDLEYGAGAISIGINTAVFNTTDNTKATIKASATSNDAYNTYYKSADTATWAIAGSQANTNMKKIYNNNTAEENEMYDAYVKLTIARNMSGDHENAAELNRGIYGSDINSDPAPLVTFQLTVAANVANGTAVNVGIPSGSYAAAAAQTYLNVFEDPGNATTATKTNADTTDASALKTQATIGAAAKEYETSIVSFWKDQIKMENDEYTSFSIRHLAQIEASVWESTFGTDEDEQSEGKKNITDIGFIFQKGDGFDKDAAANWLEAGATDNSFTKAKVNFVSTGMKDGYYVFSCTITGVDDPDAALSSLGYVVWVDDANTTHYSYFENVETETFRDLYDRYVAAH